MLQTPADPNTAAYEWWQSDTNRNLPCWTCGYGPLRGQYGFPGSNPLGNFVVGPTTANIYSSTTIGNSSANYGDLRNHFVVIVQGTGAGQSRPIVSNTATTITAGIPWTTTPDGTSVYVVLYGYCDHSKDSCAARGMLTQDSSGRTTGRFRGITYVPQDFRYKQPSGHHAMTQTDNQFAKYNNVIPIVYGTARVQGRVLFSQTANDTRGHMLVSEGPIANISEFIVGGELIPFTANYQRVDTSTGLWTFTPGNRGPATPQDPEFPVTIRTA